MYEILKTEGQDTFKVRLKGNILQSKYALKNHFLQRKNKIDEILNYLSGRSLGTKRSVDFLWSILILSVMLLDEITSHASSYIVLDISHP